MADISKIQLPSGNEYNFKDAYARRLLASGIVMELCWDGTAAPVVANIPAGVVVTYNNVDYTGTKAASTAEPLHFYLVKSGTGLNTYDEYVAVRTGEGTELSPYVYSWELFGTQTVDLSTLGTLAYKDSVTLSKGTGDNALGEDATFQTTLTPTTTAVPNVTSVGAASDWDFSLGTGADAETLIISGGNGTAPSLGTAIDAITGVTAATAVNAKDAIKVAKFDDLGVSVS